MTEGRVLSGNIFPEAPDTACSDFRITIRRMILIAVNRSLCTAAVCNKYKVVFCQHNAVFLAIDFALDQRRNLLAVLKLEYNIRHLCIKLEINPGIFKIFLHWQNQRFILIVSCEFQSTEIRQTGNMMNKSLEIQLHFQCAMPVFESKHGAPVHPEC